MVLGISLGTRVIGYAVFKDNELLDWGLKTCKGTWSTKKLKKMHQIITEVIRANEVTEVAVKVPDVIPSSKGFTQLMGSLNILFQEMGVSSSFLTLTDLKQCYYKNTKMNKCGLMEHIIAIHSELSIAYAHIPDNRKQYYMKVFEAVAAASIVQAKK